MTGQRMEGRREAERQPRKGRLGLSEQILIGLVLGIAVGVFLGELAGALEIVGDAFIMLLQMTVIPYITVSLITALGRLTLDDAKALGLKAGGVLVVLWSIGLAVVLLTPLAFPEWPSASFFSTSLVKEAPQVDFLRLYIPANPFFALANSVVPAVVVFSILIGISLISVKNKAALLEPLSTVADALMGVTGLVAKLAPYGIFALTASAAGTIDIEELSRLQVFVVVHIAMALILSFWLLPGLVTTVTPVRYWAMIRAYRGPLIAAFATGNLLIILPILAAETKQLIGDSDAEMRAEESAEAQSSVDVLIPAAFNFPNLGAILALMFVLFSGWYVGTAVPVSQYPVLAAAGLASLFGGSVLAIPFLLDLFQLPQDLFQLFITLNVLGGRFGALLAAMTIVTVALIGTFALEGRARVRLMPLARFAGITVLLLAITLMGIRGFYTYVVVAPYTKDQALKGVHLLTDPQPATVYGAVPPELAQADRAPASLGEIIERDVLRVCSSHADYPSTFFNDDDPPQLVGFDAEMAHRFARSLTVPIEFLPVDTESEGAALLKVGACDIAMVSLPITPGRTELFAMTAPVFRSSVGLIVRDHRRNAFQTWDDVRRLGVSFRLAVRGDSEALAMARALLPDAVLVPTYGPDDVRAILESEAEEVDAIGNLSEEGAAWTLLYPDFTLVVPQPTTFVPLGYSVALGNDKLLRALDAWLVAEKAKGTIDAMYRHWMLGEAALAERPPRWSVIRNVLHWID